MTEAQRFFARLFSTAPEGTFIEIRPLPRKSEKAERGAEAARARSWHPVSNFAAASKAALAASERGFDVYCGVTPRTAYGRGSAKDVASMTALWLEFDVKPGKNCASKDEARARLARLPRPTMLVDSGGGQHAYWLLHAPLLDLARGTRVMDAMREFLTVDGCPPGDNVSDPPRIMRVPGTQNLKLDEPRAVMLLDENESAYDILDLERAASTPHRENAAPSAGSNPAGDAKHTELLSNWTISVADWTERASEHRRRPRA